MQNTLFSFNQFMIIGQAMLVLGALLHIFLGQPVADTSNPELEKARHKWLQMVAGQVTFGGTLILLQGAIIVFFIEGDGLPGVGIALSIAAMVGYAALFAFLVKKVLPSERRDLLSAFEKAMLAGIFLIPLLGAVAMSTPYWA